jgi:tripartite-type tricarboxylate transporter receptor subunit TctC
MNTKQRRLSFGLSAILAMGALFSFSYPAAAQSWPAKPIRIIVPYTPGGTADGLGRMVAQKLTESLKQTFIVDNRPGAGGVIGADLVAKAVPDGYTLVVSGVASHAIVPSLSKKVPYDPIKDFTHIALFGGPPNVLVVSTNVPSQGLKEFISYAKSNPGKLTYGSPGNGSQGHLFGEQLKQLAGINLVHVPYKGASPAVTDLIGGHIDAVSSTLSSAAGQIRAGKARGLAVSSTTRVPEFPNVPTFSEMGFPELTAVTWFSLSGPAGMPKEIVQRLNKEVRQILQLPEVREKLQVEAIEPGNLDPEAFTAFVAKEIKRWEPVVRASGVQTD